MKDKLEILLREHEIDIKSCESLMFTDQNESHSIVIIQKDTLYLIDILGQKVEMKKLSLHFMSINNQTISIDDIGDLKMVIGETSDNSTLCLYNKNYLFCKLMM